MENTKNYTQTELKFRKLHKELIDLNLFELASNISEVFHKNGSENYIAGAEMAQKIHNN